MHDKIEKFAAIGDDGENYLVVRIRPYRRSDTLEEVGGYLDFAAPRLSSGEVLEPASSPFTFRVPQTGVVLTVQSPEPWCSSGAPVLPIDGRCTKTKEQLSAPRQRKSVFVGWLSRRA
jgi:hypothetical protein